VAPPRPSPGDSAPGDSTPSLSQVLRRLAADGSRARVSIDDLLTALHDRAIGSLIFVFALPNIIPMPPGASSILGTPLLFLTAQLSLGRSPWLPKFITVRSMERTQFAAVVDRVAPWLARAERLLRPRLTVLARPPFENLIGIICLLLSVILFLPIPMGNMPPAFAICLFALAILERDGVWVIGALCVAVASVAIMWGVLFALFKGTVLLLTRLLG
jgi:hypothetical protein